MPDVPRRGRHSAATDAEDLPEPAGARFDLPRDAVGGLLGGGDAERSGPRHERVQGEDDAGADPRAGGVRQGLRATRGYAAALRQARSQVTGPAGNRSHHTTPSRDTPGSDPIPTRVNSPAAGHHSLTGTPPASPAEARGASAPARDAAKEIGRAHV